jgi:hypothetical protein
LSPSLLSFGTIVIGAYLPYPLQRTWVVIGSSTLAGICLACAACVLVSLLVLPTLASDAVGAWRGQQEGCCTPVEIVCNALLVWPANVLASGGLTGLVSTPPTPAQPPHNPTALTPFCPKARHGLASVLRAAGHAASQNASLLLRPLDGVCGCDPDALYIGSRAVEVGCLARACGEV